MHKRLNELRELVQYYEQTSDMVVDTVNENVKDEDEETEDGSLFETMFDSEQENHEPVTNIRYRQRKEVTECYFLFTVFSEHCILNFCSVLAYSGFRITVRIIQLQEVAPKKSFFVIQKSSPTTDSRELDGLKQSDKSS